MNFRLLGKTNQKISEIGLGTWQLGAKWGEKFNEDVAFSILDAAYNNGINLIDTADIYNNGLSEEIIGKYLKKHPNSFYVITKCGRQLDPHTADKIGRAHV